MDRLSFILAVVTVVCSAAGAVLPALLNFLCKKREMRFGFYERHSAEAIDDFLSCAAKFLYENNSNLDHEKLFSALARVSVYAKPDTAQLMQEYCDTVNKNLKGADALAARRAAFYALSAALRQNVPRSLRR